MKRKKVEERVGGEIEGRKYEGEIGERLKRIERKMEMEARKDRRENSLIKGIEVEEERRREAIKELFRIV